VKNKRILILLGFVFFSFALILSPRPGSAEGEVIIPGIVEVEENHLYMVPIGTDDGVKKGDTVEIIRNDQKIADARLISVLSDNSMAEIVVMFIRTDILESDSVKFTEKKDEVARAARRKTLTTSERTVVEEAPARAVTEVKASEDKRRGLLGSEMHRYEEVAAVEGPLKQEIEQLKAGLVTVRDEYEGKIDTILSSVQGSSKDALAVEKKWQDKLISTEKRYQAQYNERKKLLERESARLEAKVAQLTNELKVVNEGTDKRIEQLLSDLKEKEAEISSIKKQFVEEHLAGEKQWQAKLENLEAQYQGQLRTLEESLKKESATSQEQSQKDISSLAGELASVREQARSATDNFQIRLKEREDLIDALRQDQIALESDLSRERERANKLEGDIVTLKDVIAAAKRVHEKELAFAQKPLEKKIEDMSVDFIATKHQYENELNALRQGAQEDLLKNESQWVEKLASVEQNYQTQLNDLNVKTAAQVNQLRAELEGQNNVIDLLKQNNAELAAKLQASEQAFALAHNDIKTLEKQITIDRATRTEKINLAKQPLEAKVAELSAQIVVLQKQHEAKTGEDASVIEFLNGSMAELTSDLEAREKQLGELQERFSISQNELEALKKSYTDGIALAKKPLEDQMEDLYAQSVALKADYENQIKTLQENASRDLLASEEKWQMQWAAKEAEMDTAKQSLADQVLALQASMDSLNKEHDAKVQEMAAIAEKDQASVNEQWQAKLAQLQDDHQKELALKLRERQGVIDGLESEKLELARQIPALQEEYEKKMKAVEDEFAQNQSVSDQKWQERLAQIQNDYQGELGTKLQEKQVAIDRLESEKLELAKQIPALQEDYEKKIKLLIEESGRDRAVSDQQWQANLAQLQDDHQKELETRLQERQTIIDQLEDEKFELAKQIPVLQEEYEKKMKVIADEFAQNKTSNDQQWQAKLDEKDTAIALLENERLGLTEQLSALKKDSSSVIEELQVQSSRKQEEIDALTTAKSDLASQLAQTGSLLAKAQNDIAVLKSQISETEAARATWITSVKKPLEDEVKKLNDEIVQLNEAHKNEIQAIEQNAAANAESLDKKWQEKLAEKDGEIAELTKASEIASQSRIAENDQVWADKMAKAEQAYQEQLKKQEEGLQAKIADLSQALEVLRKDSGSVIVQLQTDLKAKQTAIDALENTKSGFETAITQKEEELSGLRDEIAQLKKDLKASDSLKDNAAKSSAEIARLKDQMQELKGANAREEEALKKDLEIERQTVADLEKKLAEQESSSIQRAQLAKESLEAEIKTLKAELAFTKSQHEQKTTALLERASENQTVSEKEGQAKLAAKEAEWQARWAAREAEHQEELNAELAALEQKLFGGKKEVRQTVVDLNNRLSMLKNSSDSQIRELEAELAAQQYQLSIKESEAQERLIEAEKKWKDNAALLEKAYQEKLEQEKRALNENFLAEKKELRETVVDLTRQFSELRDGSNSRIKALETEIEKRDYKISLLENSSEQNIVGTEEKWQAKLTALEEKRQRELLEQKRDMQNQSLVMQEKLQATVADLTKQLDAMRDQSRLDLAMKDEERAAEVALLERKYQDQLSTAKTGTSNEVAQLSAKVQWQQDLIDSLKTEKSGLTLDLEERERELARYRASIEDLKKESKMAELTQSERVRLSKQSLESQIQDLTAQLSIANKKAEQDRAALEDLWKNKLARAEEEYLQKLKLQRQSMEQEKADLNNRVGSLASTRDEEINEIRAELEDNQTLIRLLSKEKYDLADKLEAKSREIVRLNEEIIDLKEGLETYKDLASSGTAGGYDIKSDGNIASEEKSRYGNNTIATTEDYYTVVRKAILDKFKESDFSKYEGREDVVKIDFELFANGSPKKGPEFFGTEDEGLKDLLTQCFEDALPFPPFPENLGKESQRFSLGISFRKK